MLKCRTILNELYKRNKKLQKHKSGGGKTHNKIIPKILSLSVSASLMLAMVPNNGAFAAEPTTFVTSAFANHWGRSDLRAYLNNGLATVAENGSVSNKNYGLNSTEGECNSNNTSGFAKQFSNAEYELVQPFTYSTNVLDGPADAEYETIDKFWLPSGNYSNNQIISWGAKDISANSQYLQTTTNDKDRIIPISYWSYGNSFYSWLRSPHYRIGDSALTASRGLYVDFRDVYIRSPSQAAACKIHLESVIFASAASAASISIAAAGGAKKIDISGSSNFGQKVTDALPDYGMYLKTSSKDSFAANSLTLSGNTLTVSYSGGAAGQYVVVHAFKEDSLTGGHTSYVAAKKLAAGGTSETIDVSAWGLSSLNGYTIKVWMEDGSGSLAKATMPVTFVGTEKKEDGASTNARVFAMKADLQTSWGDLSALSEEDYNNVISGNSASVNSGIMGTNPTNQKIYFGAKDGQPLEFWIAGRESAANAGSISANGNIMTLYQAKSVETKQFNVSTSGYKESPTVALQDGQSITYTGSSAVYSGTVTYQNLEGTDLELPKNNPTYQYSTDGGSTWTDGMPTNAGTYKIRAKVAANDNYESATSAPVTFIIDKKSITPQITAENKDYDGNSEATVTVEFDSLVAGETLEKNVDYTIDSATFDNTNAGNGKTVTATISLTESAKAKNYQLSSKQATTADIDPKKITVKAEDKWKYFGNDDPELTYTAEGLIGTEKLEGQLERAPGSEVGTYEIKQGTLTNDNNPNYNIDFTPGTFTIKVDKSGWGTPEEHGEIIHYVDAEGMTSVEVTENGIIWLREESYDSNLGRNTAAWYGLDNTSGIFKKGSRFYVQWLNENDHPEAFANIDSNTKAEVEDDNGWLFKVGVIAPDGTRYEKLDEKVDLYVQIGDDWDRDDLAAFYISQGEDENIPVRYETSDYPEGEDEFGIMTLSHFSPYFIYDKLTDEEKAEADESTKTGDEVTYFAVSGLGLIMTLALGLMLNSKINKKKSD